MKRPKKLTKAQVNAEALAIVRALAQNHTTKWHGVWVRKGLALERRALALRPYLKEA